MKLGEKVSSLRKSKGISQEILAERCGVSLRTVQRIERDEASPRSYTLTAIAGALNIRVEELTNYTPEGEQFNEEEIVRLRQINFASLAGLLIPLTNIALTWFLWRRHRGLALVDKVGRKIISFQILWTGATILFLVSARLIQASVTGSVAVGHFPPAFVIVYVALLIVNFIVVTRAAILLSQDKYSIYSSVPVLI